MSRKIISSRQPLVENFQAWREPTAYRAPSPHQKVFLSPSTYCRQVESRILSWCIKPVKYNNKLQIKNNVNMT